VVFSRPVATRASSKAVDDEPDAVGQPEYGVDDE
jgi:hypothetical protein